MSTYDTLSLFSVTTLCSDITCPPDQRDGLCSSPLGVVWPVFQTGEPGSNPLPFLRIPVLFLTFLGSYDYACFDPQHP